MAAQIAEHATVREQFAARLIEEGVVTQEEADELLAEVTSELKQAHEALKATFGDAASSRGEDPVLQRRRGGHGCLRPIACAS